MAGASIETTLELWASSLRDVKARMSGLFTQERVAASANLFLDGLLGDERRKTGWMRAEAAGDPGPWRQQAILGRGRWDADALRDNGTTSLFAALDVATGAVIGQCYKRHRATEFLDFLKRIDAEMPKGPEVHLVMHNYATHKTPRIKAWLARRPHWHVHFTPTSASWINQVERWFAELTRKQLQRGVHRSTAELKADIDAFITTHNENPKPYTWVKSADQILASVKRFCQKTMSRTSDSGD